VLRAGLAAELGQRIRQAVLALGAGKAEALKLGGKVSHIDGFIAVDDHHYDSVRAIAAYMTDTRPRGR
jgi:ABC-type phosphate/phosphonate transport system substrate-binding protein